MARRKKYVGEYSDEDLAKLKPDYRNRIVSYRRQIGPFGLVSEARGHGTGERLSSPPTIGPLYAEPEYTSGTITKAKAEVLSLVILQVSALQYILERLESIF